MRVRGAQQVAAWAERRGWSARTHLPDDAVFFKSLDRISGIDAEISAARLLEHFRERAALTGPNFFASFSDREGTVKMLKRRWPENVDDTVERADQIEAGFFDLLGLRGLSFGTPVDWHLEPLSGKRSPLMHWSRLGELDAGETGDKKIVWEVNRHQHFVTLGRAYWITADERYARIFAEHVTSWMDQNPPTVGLNWLSSLEVAFRSISWLWAIHFFKDSLNLTPDLFLRVLKYLFLHARHLETYLSTYSSPNTHLTGEALGLFYLGTLLPEFRSAGRWRTAAQAILLDELPRHVKPDGTYFEQSSYYHRYTTDFYTHFLILSQANGQLLPDQVGIKLQALMDHLMYITRPDGTTPLFGDDDGGRLLFFDHRAANDFRSSLSTGAALFERSDYKSVAREGAEETLWLLGPTGLEGFDGIPAREPEKQSYAFEDGGCYVMRDGWTPVANYLLFDSGPHGALSCGHSHADALSFDLAANGRTLLVDPGTFTYTGSSELRDWFRGSSAHNTLTVDGESSSEPDGPFSWKSIARAETESWISRERFDYMVGKHDGYLRLPAPVTHTRSILFLKNDYWIMRDQVTSTAEHLYALCFHLTPEQTGKVDSERALMIGELPDQAQLNILAFAPGGRWSLEAAAVSHCYGSKVRAAVGVFSATATDAEVVTFLLPLAGTRPAATKVIEVEAIGGRAFEVISETAVDLVMIRDAQRVETRVETARMASDFDWTWARFSVAGVLEELVSISGQTLELEGQEILKSRHLLSHLAARRGGSGELRISDCEFRNGDGDPGAEIEIRTPTIPTQTKTRSTKRHERTRKDTDQERH